MGKLEEAINTGLKTAMDRNAGGIINTVLDALWSHRWFPFIVGAQVRLMEMGMKPREAWDLARTTLVNYCRDEKIRFGDPAYDWGPSGGREVIQAYEIDHWES